MGVWKYEEIMRGCAGWRRWVRCATRAVIITPGGTAKEGYTQFHKFSRSNLQSLHLTLQVVISPIQVDPCRVKQRYVGLVKPSRHIVHRLIENNTHYIQSYILHTVFIITDQSLFVICTIYFPGGPMIAARNGLNRSRHIIFEYSICYTLPL